jgi:4-aminobutyrate aminotransferase
MTAVEHDHDLSTAWLARDEAVLAPVLGRYSDFVAASGEGLWLTDIDGRRVLDLTSGIGVTQVGHCHPRVTAAIVEQAGRLVHTSVTTHHTRSIELAERIGALCPWFEEPQLFFSNTGAEVVDGVMKMARRTTGRPGIVAFTGGFHGRTLGATSLTTTKAHYRSGYEPLVPSVYFAPYGDPRRHASAEGALAELDQLFDSRVDPGQVAALIVEPVLGEGGYVVPLDGWLAGLRRRCDEHGILLVFDEVQCGIGRTGAWTAGERFGVAPDVLLLAKGLAGGLPLAAIVASRSTFASWPTAAHGSTFGGNPVACASALAVLDVIAEDGLLERADRLGRRCLEALTPLAGTAGAVVGVRGIGLMVGVELVSGAVCDDVRRRAMEEDVLLLSCGSHGEVVRLVPALTISDDELELGLDVLTRAIRASG